MCQSGPVPRFEPFRGLRYSPRRAPIGDVMAPPVRRHQLGRAGAFRLPPPGQRRPGRAARTRPPGRPRPLPGGGRPLHALAGRRHPRPRSGAVPVPLPDDRHQRACDHRGDRRARAGRSGARERHPAPRADPAQAQERPARPPAGHPGQPLAHLGAVDAPRPDRHLRPHRRRAHRRRLRRRGGAPPALGARRPRRHRGHRHRGRRRPGGDRRRASSLRDGARRIKPSAGRRTGTSPAPTISSWPSWSSWPPISSRWAPSIAPCRACRRASTSSGPARPGSTWCGPARPTSAPSGRWPKRAPSAW